ncbi:hypothetical protein [Streptomyces sp. HUAS ZL42]|uniref:hypothetical protein n=1 Tax=Streptomyces sp. HUAS ZL42 TaxID=3231715 RepID=UPI00345E51A4
MGSLKVTLCAGVALIAAALPSAAYATDGRGVSVTPSTPAPGADVALRVSGCTSKTATAVSAAFVSDARLTGSDGTLTGETRVRTSLTAGAYVVKITCADFEIKGSVTVVEKSALPVVPASPVAPVHAGGGGTARLASAEEAHVEGPGTAHAVTGLILAGVAAVAVAFRGARRGRGTD